MPYISMIIVWTFVHIYVDIRISLALYVVIFEDVYSGCVSTFCRTAPRVWSNLALNADCASPSLVGWFFETPVGWLSSWQLKENHLAVEVWTYSIHYTGKVDEWYGLDHGMNEANSRRRSSSSISRFSNKNDHFKSIKYKKQCDEQVQPGLVLKKLYLLCQSEEKKAPDMASPNVTSSFLPGFWGFLLSKSLEIGRYRPPFIPFGGICHQNGCP